MPSDIPRERSFFWQGVFILLPVVLLAVVSLISLREEERGAAADGRNKAKQNAESLSRAVRSFVDEKLPR
jgi:hypothetical protein